MPNILIGFAEIYWMSLLFIASCSGSRDTYSNYQVVILHFLKILHQALFQIYFTINNNFFNETVKIQRICKQKCIKHCNVVYELHKILRIN